MFSSVLLPVSQGEFVTFAGQILHKMDVLIHLFRFLNSGLFG